MNGKRMLAFVCRICPPCVLGRKFPASRLGRIIAKEKKHCPFCRAYDELFVKPRGTADALAR